MEKTRYCTKCKNVFKVNDLAPDSFRCPYCGHVITPYEDSTFQTFGLLGTKKGCGCLLVIILLVVLFLIFAGGKSNNAAPKTEKTEAANGDVRGANTENASPTSDRHPARQTEDRDPKTDDASGDAKNSGGDANRH